MVSSQRDTDALRTPGQATALELIGGVLCLDFANTLAPRVARPADTRHEYLTDYADLLDWSLHAQAIERDDMPHLRARAAARKVAARAALNDALTLREAIYRTCLALATHGRPHAADLAALSAAYTSALENTLLLVEGIGVVRDWVGDREDLTRPVWSIARSAVEWLLTAEPARVKACPAEGGGCGRLFYDTSKNNSRRWCSMRTCGGFEKERRRALRKRQ